MLPRPIVKAFLKNNSLTIVTLREFLAVGALVLFSIVLREKGSPESKPVQASHAHTGP